MLKQLAKYAAVSRQIHRAVLIKENGILGALGKGAVSALKAHPIATPLAALSIAGGAAAAKGKYQQYKAGFDPQVQRMQMGQVPTPPGVQ